MSFVIDERCQWEMPISDVRTISPTFSNMWCKNHNVSWPLPVMQDWYHWWARICVTRTERLENGKGSNYRMKLRFTKIKQKTVQDCWQPATPSKQCTEFTYFVQVFFYVHQIFTISGIMLLDIMSLEIHLYSITFQTEKTLAASSGQ